MSFLIAFVGAVGIPNYLDKWNGEGAVRYLLRDRRSASFRNVYVTGDNLDRNIIEFGEVKAKNRLGAMVGYHRFISIDGNPAQTVVEPPSAFEEECSENFKPARKEYCY